MPRYDMVDISNNNGIMTVANFLSMKKKGVKAIVQKLSEGTYYADSTAKTNIANARKAGLYVHGYHFARFTTVVGAKAEAQLAVKMAKACGLNKDSVIVNDYESNNLGWVRNGAVNQAFEDEIHRLGYPKTDIYTMGSWTDSMPINNSKRRGWIANYPYDPIGKKYYGSYNSWQWTSSATFTGCYGHFDVSVLYSNFYLGGKIANDKPSYYKSTKLGLYEVIAPNAWIYKKKNFGKLTQSDMRYARGSRIWAQATKYGEITHLKLKYANGYITSNAAYVKRIYFKK